MHLALGLSWGPSSLALVHLPTSSTSDPGYWNSWLSWPALLVSSGLVMNVTPAGVQTCLWVQGSRTESSWQLLTAVLLLVCWRVKNTKSLEKVLQVRGSIQSPEFPEFFRNGSKRSGVLENSGVTIEWEKSGSLSPEGTQPDRQSLRQSGERGVKQKQVRAR